MQQKKRTRYDFYKDRAYCLANTYKKFVRSIDPSGYAKLKKMPDETIMLDMFRADPHNMINSLDTPILADEIAWKESGRHVIYPESAHLVDRLLNAKFDFSHTGGINLPFSEFVLALPAGYQYKGVRLHGILVSIHPVKDIQIRFNKVLRWIGLEDNLLKVKHNLDGTDESVLSISTLDNSGNYSTIRTSESLSRLASILSAENYHEFTERLGKTSEQVNYTIADLGDEDQKIQFYANRLVAALSVYTMATEGDMLRQGFPQGALPKFDGKMEAPKRASSYVLKDIIESMGNNTGKQSHVRNWHFRQLRDKRYYRNRYADMPIGSRWVFVRESVVNSSRVEPYTLYE
jgi:hypothetical protein